MTTADFFAYNGSRSISWYAYIRRRARHAVARARTTGVRVDNGCRYHLVFMAGRRKGDVWSVHLRLARGGQLLDSCFSFSRLAAASQTPPPLPFLLPRPRNGPFLLGRTHMPTGLPSSLLLNTCRPLRFYLQLAIVIRSQIIINMRIRFTINEN